MVSQFVSLNDDEKWYNVAYLPIIRNVSSHSSETSVSCKGEPRQATQVKVVSVDLHKVVFQATREFVAAKRSSKKRILSGVTLRG